MSRTLPVTTMQRISCRMRWAPICSVDKLSRLCCNSAVFYCNIAPIGVRPEKTDYWSWLRLMTIVYFLSCRSQSKKKNIKTKHKKCLPVHKPKHIVGSLSQKSPFCRDSFGKKTRQSIAPTAEPWSNGYHLMFSRLIVTLTPKTSSYIYLNIYIWYIEFLVL